MAQKQFVCLRCSEKFWIELISYEEAVERKIPTSPPACRVCGRVDVKPVEEIM